MVRVLVMLLMSGAIVLRLLVLSGRPGADDEPAEDPGAEPEQEPAPEGESGAEPETAPVTEASEGLPDNARQRAPWLVRAGIALTPLAGSLGLALAVLGFLARNQDWELPIIGPVIGDWPLAVLLLSIAVWAVWLLWQVPRWQAAAWRRSAELKEREIFDIENSSRATLGQILSGVAVLAGLIFAWQQLGNTSQTLFVSQEGQITDRFSRAVGQLGDEDLTIRIGGIYALERIARDSERDHETVMEILAAFARQRSATESVAAAAELGTSTPAVTGGTVPLTSVRDIPLDLDVVLKVISRRDSSRDGEGCIDLSDIKLAGFRLGGSRLDLTNVCLRDADLRSAELVGVDLSGADLAGTNFRGANLDRANLAGAQLTSTDFSGAVLSQANMTGAILTGANLQGANLQGTVLRDAILNGTDLSQAIMSGTDLQGANLMDANLEGASMFGVDLRGASSLTSEQVEAATIDGTSQFPPDIAATPDF